MNNKYSSVFFTCVLIHLETFGHSQLIGEEKKYAFMEQAMLERMRTTMVRMVKSLEARIERLEEDNKRILEELKSKTCNVENLISERTNGCPTSKSCVIRDLQCPRFYMDPATLNTQKAYLSSDKLTLTNRRMNTSYEWPVGTARKHQGARGSIVFTNTDKIFFEADIFYRIEANLSSTNLVFEVAFATEKAIGKSHYVGRQNGAWSISAHNSGREGVKLFFKSNGGSIVYNETLSNANSGTEKNLKLGFYINRVARIISVFDIGMNRKIYTFIDVDDQQALWPVFGVYQASKTDVRLILNTQENISRLPCDVC
ncbi:uncharacterized protein LOC132554842 [Ylistrum balloti]|uniref:uncharacterized protein LOC132554842 n=1 Tax=Ylistrum balloti TaxID=509963 RepID=UPI002905BAE1|nr:uncharacterized protein LOC132554842 [Ylistrum balloti]